MEPEPVHIAILAGGQSKRMGHNKALMRLGGKTLIEHVLNTAAPLSLPTFIIGETETYTHLGLPVHPDHHPDLGPIGGLYTALVTALCPVLLLACDQPFLTPQFLHYILSRRGDHQALVPHTDEGSQPLCALYESACLGVVESAITAKSLSMRSLLRKLDLLTISTGDWQPYDEQGLLFANLNTPEEFEHAQRRWESS